MKKFAISIEDVLITINKDSYDPRSRCAYTTAADGVTIVYNITTSIPVGLKRLKKLWNNNEYLKRFFGRLTNVVDKSVYKYPINRDVRLNEILLRVYSSKPEGRGGVAFAPLNEEDKTFDVPNVITMTPQTA